MSSSSGGNMNNEDVVVGQWLDASQQNKPEHGSNLVLFAVSIIIIKKLVLLLTDTK